VDTGICTMCPTECSACTDATTCTECEEGYSLNTGSCDSNCGNSERNELESCDDGNTDDNDGCSSTCSTEPLYICYAQPSAADDCYCDPHLISARWLNNWREIEIILGTEVNINATSLGSAASTSPITL
jgi:cysteine-rich repeat protein